MYFSYDEYADVYNVKDVVTRKDHRCEGCSEVIVAPVVAGQNLDPGQKVGMTSEGTARGDETAIGIVDPFIQGMVSTGEMFWMCLFPETVTGMTHHWRHPDFPADHPEEHVEAAKQWLEAKAKDT